MCPKMQPYRPRCGSVSTDIVMRFESTLADKSVHLQLLEKPHGLQLRLRTVRKKYPTPRRRPPSQHTQMVEIRSQSCAQGKGEKAFLLPTTVGRYRIKTARILLWR